jgi:hypothetical protein
VGAVDEDVVALDVAVYYWRVVGVKIEEALEDLPRPALNNLHVRRLQLANVPFLEVSLA